MTNSTENWNNMHQEHMRIVDGMQHLAPGMVKDPAVIMQGKVNARNLWRELDENTDCLYGYLVCTQDEISGLKMAIKEGLSTDGPHLMGQLIVNILKFHYMMEYAP